MQKFPKSPKAPVYSPFEEPVEVGKTAVEQVMGTGAKEPDEPLVSQPQQESLPEEIVEAQHRARLGQLRQEVQQVRPKKEQEQVEAEKELVSRREQEEQDKRPAPIEPSTRRPRGVWAGVAGLVKKLQRRVESPRGPVQ